MIKLMDAVKVVPGSPIATRIDASVNMFSKLTVSWATEVWAAAMNTSKSDR